MPSYKVADSEVSARLMKPEQKPEPEVSSTINTPRTCSGWLKLIVFYMVFYSFLAMFTLTYWSFYMRTVDLRHPRYYGKDSIIGVLPGVGYQPCDTIDTRVCTLDDIHKGDSSKNISAQLPCRFDLAAFEEAGCSASNNYGYMSGTPCVAISLNRLLGWKPTAYHPGHIPREVFGRYHPGSVAIHCKEAKTDNKTRNFKDVLYIPPHGIDGRFYPYTVVHNYHQPIAMVRFSNVTRNRLVTIDCKAYAGNIVHDLPTRLGLVRFELLIHDTVVAKNTTVVMKNDAPVVENATHTTAH
ncbi:unnamed protein product, partial [Mesorhabditis spiculigera]